MKKKEVFPKTIPLSVCKMMISITQPHTIIYYAPLKSIEEDLYKATTNLNLYFIFNYYNKVVYIIQNSQKLSKQVSELFGRISGGGGRHSKRIDECLRLAKALGLELLRDVL